MIVGGLLISSGVIPPSPRSAHCDPMTWGELLALLSLPFWPALRLMEFGTDRILNRAYHRRAREARALHKAYVERLRELSSAPVFSRDEYWRTVQEFAAARDRLQEEFARDDRAGAALFSSNGRIAPFFSGKALAGRAKRRRRREPAWRKWVRALAEWATNRHGPPPAPPLFPGRTLRKLCEQSLRPAPSAEALLTQYERARGRGRVEEKIRLGSMLLDLEAAVDNGAIRDEDGEIVGRNPGLLGWLRENCRELAPHYAALQGYRRMAHAFRKRHGVADPVPAELLLEASPKEEAKLPSPTADALAAARERARRWIREWGGATASAAADALWNGRPLHVQKRPPRGRPPGRAAPERVLRWVRMRKTE